MIVEKGMGYTFLGHMKALRWFFDEISSPEFVELPQEILIEYEKPLLWLCAQYLERAKNEEKQPHGKYEHVHIFLFFNLF